MSNINGFVRALPAAAMLAMLAMLACGCKPDAGPAPPAASRQAVPAPLDQLLPQRIRIHSFTRTGEFGENSDGVKGIDVRIQAVDAYGDAAKAFGRFRFELFRHRPNAADPRGPRLAVWTVDVLSPKPNRLHWNSIMRTYQFKLGWDDGVPVGQKLVLTATFESPFTERLFHQYVFVSGDSGPGPL